MGLTIGEWTVANNTIILSAIW